MDKFKLIQIAVLVLFPLSSIAQKVEIYDEGGVKYAAVNCDDIPRKTEDRSTNTNFYVDADLYTYTSTGETSTQMTDESGNPIVVKRVKRHTTGNQSSSVDYNISKRFIVSPTIVYSNGTTDGAGGGTATMDWATANGYLVTANTNPSTTQSSATPRGCSQYKGKAGTDAGETWRVPTHKEGALIAIFYKDLEDTSGDTDFQPFPVNSKNTYYWLATETTGYSSQAWYMFFDINAKGRQFLMNDGKKKSEKCYLRCIRDIK